MELCNLLLSYQISVLHLLFLVGVLITGRLIQQHILTRKWEEAKSVIQNRGYTLELVDGFVVSEDQDLVSAVGRVGAKGYLVVNQNKELVSRVITTAKSGSFKSEI
ncbi:hypothetical protein OH460_07470 [Vibrio sp. Makdt]|uniref:hypothetical protein n=1 Tax=Vibrio sp. Makdt TaxID=2998828 RepID=UPI0022CD44FA|nr:hypothetical protein [Vibrio sp. Makdt]MDA0152136.1 hypothetical protein [Vibrio sp. Makdt]